MTQAAVTTPDLFYVWSVLRVQYTNNQGTDNLGRPDTGRGLRRRGPVRVLGI